jgi:hypothetical protein
VGAPAALANRTLDRGMGLQDDRRQRAPAHGNLDDARARREQPGLDVLEPEIVEVVDRVALPDRPVARPQQRLAEHEVHAALVQVAMRRDAAMSRARARHRRAVARDPAVAQTEHVDAR